MSIHERLAFKALPDLHEELMVTPYADGTDEPRAVAIPRPKDLALALAGATDEWFTTFLAHLYLGWPNRALAVARAAESMGLQHLASDEKALSDLAAAFGISQDNLIGTVLGSGWQLLPAARAVLALSTDVTGGDCDPGFGVSPEDSARLLELRQAIDALGWNTHEEEEAGDYLGRLQQIREELAVADKVHARNAELERRNKSQRAELRRFNQERAAYNKGAEAQLKDTFKRWPQARPTEEQLRDLMQAWPSPLSHSSQVSIDRFRTLVEKLATALGMKPR